MPPHGCDITDTMEHRVRDVHHHGHEDDVPRRTSRQRSTFDDRRQNFKPYVVNVLA